MSDFFPGTSRDFPEPATAGTVPCLYCREPIATGAFRYWSAGRQLLSATCATCQRRVTLPAATWRRYLGADGGAAVQA